MDEQGFGNTGKCRTKNVILKLLKLKILCSMLRRSRVAEKVDNKREEKVKCD